MIQNIIILIHPSPLIPHPLLLWCLCRSATHAKINSLCYKTGEGREMANCRHTTARTSPKGRRNRWTLAKHTVSHP